MLTAEAQSPERTWIDVAQRRFETDNAGLAAETELLLDRIVADVPNHARLLNTLSLLEHIGSHKIMATQHSSRIDQPTLRHVAEEAHHAYFMKRQAEKVAGHSFSYRDEELLAAATSRMYFQRLEGTVVRHIGRTPRGAYLYMSLIVEFRALWFYRIYQRALRRASIPISLKRILGEEQNHLNEMAAQLMREDDRTVERVDSFLPAEQTVYARMLRAIGEAA